MKKTDLIPFVVVDFCVYLGNWQGDVVFWGCKRVRRLANSCVNRLVGIVFFRTPSGGMARHLDGSGWVAVVLSVDSCGFAC